MDSEQRFVANATCATDSLSLLALTYHAQGRGTEAEETLQDLNQYAIELNHAAALAAVAALRARLAVARDDLDTARAMFPWLNSPGAPPAPMLWMFPPSIIQAHILVADDDEEGWKIAVERLAELEQFARSTHDHWRLQTIRSLQAVAYVHLGRRSKAIALALDALTAAQPERLVRTFADCGPEFAKLLQAVRRQGLPSSLARYIDDILNAIGFPHHVTEPKASAQHDLSGAQAHLISPLTDREIEVLFMLDQRYSDKEIAHALVISTYTVQTHTRSIYRKLEVGDRREAALKARSLGFISQTSSVAMQQP
jgi:ATP/maltotriose-dependent transcriptional regulator MalT